MEELLKCGNVKEDFKHIFIFQEGMWRANGTYIDENNKKCLLEADFSIIHDSDIWNLDKVINVQTKLPLDMHVKYDLDVLIRGSKSTNWVSYNSVTGNIKGKFVIAGDTIISEYATENGFYKGIELLVQDDEDKYNVSGVLIEQKKVVCSWNAKLLRNE